MKRLIALFFCLFMTTVIGAFKNDDYMNKLYIDSSLISTNDTVSFNEELYSTGNVTVEIRLSYDSFDKELNGLDFNKNNAYQYYYNNNKVVTNSEIYHESVGFSYKFNRVESEPVDPGPSSC